MCMSKAAPAPPPPEAPPPPPTVLDTKVDATRNRQYRARGVQGGPESAMTGAGLSPQTAGASPVLGT